MSSYCEPKDHIWVALVGGYGFDADYDTTVCIRCECYSGVRRMDTSARPAHPDTQIGRR